MPDRETMCEYPSLGEIQRLLGIGWVLEWHRGMQVFELRKKDKSIELAYLSVVELFRDTDYWLEGGF